MITSNLARVGETRVALLKESDLGKAMGIRLDSVVVADNLATVEDQIIDKKIDKKIGHCSDMEAVNTALKKALGI
jgi:mRNA-degrading endonuclease toxin of MazEF toxin-antitoxin module